MDINSVNYSGFAQNVQSASKLNETNEANKMTGLSTALDISGSKENSIEELKVQADSINNMLSQLGQAVTFSIDEGTQSSVVKLVDKTTDEVIKQYPNEGSLEMMKNIQNYLESVQKTGLSSKEGLTGILFNEII